MKKFVTLLGLAILALALPAAAQDTNGIGFYFDEAGTNNYMPSAAPYTLVNAYLMATRITSSAGLSGWEAEVLVVPTPAVPPSYTVNGGGINVLTAPIFQVGLGSALPYAPAIKLLTVGVLNFGTPFTLAIGPCNPSSFNGLRPGYADGANPGLLIGLTPSANLPVAGRPNFFTVASFMSSPPVAVENDSWGSVKNLYQ